jgi:hypothetical protein
VKKHFYLILVAVLVLKSSSAFAQAGSDSAAQFKAASAAGAIDDSGVPLVAEGFVPAEASKGLIKLEGFGKAWPEILAEPDYVKIRKNIADYSAAQQQCRAKEDKANKFCIEARNPDVQKYAMFAQTIMAGVSGFTDSCSKFSKLMNLGNTALGLYQAQCGLWKGMCSSSCSTAVKGVTDAKANLKKLSATYVAESKRVAAKWRAVQPPGTGEEAAKWYDKAAIDMPKYIDQYEKTLLDRELVAGGADYKPVAKKLETCNGYAKQLATSVLGAAGMLKSAAGADKCEEDSSNNPTAVAGNGPVDCTIPANKTSNMTCICLDAPRTPGCDSLLDSPTSAKNLDVARAASTSDYIPTTPTGGKIDLGGSGDGLDLASKSAGSGSGSSAPGGPGGRAAGIDGGSAGGGGAGGSAAEKKSALNTNILGGEGGGGGGGSWGGGGGDDGLRQYLPGGAKDPNAQGVAGQGAGAAGGATGPAGKSNWEKVRDRYRDNNRTLLNN